MQDLPGVRLAGVLDWRLTLSGGKESKSLDWHENAFGILTITHLTLWESEHDCRSKHAAERTLPLSHATVTSLSKSPDVKFESNVFLLGDQMEEILIHVTAKDELERWSSRLASTCEDAKGVSLAGISQLVGRSESPDSPRKGALAAQGVQRVRSKPRVGLFAASSAYSLTSAAAEEGDEDFEDMLFGQNIQEQADREDREMPLLVTKCIAYIEKEGLKAEGIYRLSGNALGIKSLKRKLARANMKFTTLEKEGADDVHVVAGLLKGYFRELKQPLCTFKLYNKFMQAAQVKTSVDDQRTALRTVLRLLPPANFATFHALAKHLQLVASYGDTNKMLVVNLAIVFGPTLFRDETNSMASMIIQTPMQAQIVQLLLTDPDWFFADFDRPETTFE